MQDGVCERFVRRYLLSKNFKDTLNAFEIEYSKEKSRGKFQPLDIIDQLQEAIYDSNLSQLTNQWNFLENTLFHRLSGDKQLAANELKVHVFRTYLVQAKIKKRQAKMTEFFELLSSQFSFGKEEWQSWCALPYAADPKMHSEFFMYFTKSWMDVLILSLTNFLCLINYSESNQSRVFFETEFSNQKNKSSTNEKTSTSGNQLPFGELLDDFNELGTIRTNSKLS
ncbi:unnamed protein product [Schistosoma margrebowiei]|uniref:Lissencephaly type-1-like homology motif,domain-containing protein n=1 Tax=Schistosoma margrebowiei TaxID=48269 RepID=A0A183MPC2_9TREM|nr:unnamed protein product [Schistosoma margrebowiei]VDP25664.1 unnamed protein product [Schistosoma margrebowiei]